MTNHHPPVKLTDDAVSRLPLAAGRAELLEEIMSTEAPDRTVPVVPLRSRRWVAPLAAAAVVAGIAASSVWWAGGPDGSTTPVATASSATTSTPSSAPSATATDPAGATSPAGPAGPAQPAVSGHRAILDLPGWAATSTEDDGDDYGEVQLSNGDQSLTVTWYDAASYQSYVTDREHIVDPAAPGEPIEVLGLGAQLWAYSADDHTAIREVQDGHWMEFRGSGMDQAAYLKLLGSLRMVDKADYEAALPDSFVSSDERLPTALEMLSGIKTASGADLPAGQTFSLDSDEQDPYQLGAYVAGYYACAWFDEFADATRSGDAARAAEAARVLGTSRDWPVLNDMNAQGDYPEVLWDYADTAATGRIPEGYAGGLGCS